MSERVLLKTPAEIFDNGWKSTEVVITESDITFANTKIQSREIQDLEKLEYAGKEAVRIKKDRNYYLNFGSRQQQIFRYLAFNLKSDRFAVYFLSPATRGGVVVKDSKWEKGYLSITDEAIWFLSPSKQLRISLNSLGSVGKDVRTIGGKQRVVLVVTHVEKGEVITSFVLCPETTLEMLQNYLQQLIDMHKPKEKLSDAEEQILTMVYTGVDSVSIESILGVSTDELNRYFDRFVDLGLAKVVKIRKEVELTPKGAALVSEIMKKAAR
ncbi:CheF family chemotaxis protein [Methermicoccus shengliensis]|uniref:Taxis protein n=1 Tax=Methermicoccus shengliensis TaxID=660064 RepID=A0A832VZ96_9EURY|nr:CheF family chemotaxis protein [Methermicoccus shengliensis]KUK04658.1 MAG: hypothetical protein XD46_0635 [Euryarchaeota archaeon 55_53]KUK30785.1 MAG: hypothetical protein XD62_0163 [Methanosarcinales archeaon 56_1174]MDI3487948.1 taxis protein CheF [Methanosarcinales archaeon]MDN5295086.1 taxis protein CheF [Methanosarcinales archaeon]HIH69110.1 hypothetical protein [Methermicoccus shengliensis]